LSVRELSALTVVAIALAAVLFVYYAYRLKQAAQGDISEEGWEAARGIVYRAVDNAVAIGQAAGQGEAAIIEAAVRITFDEIQLSELPEADKAFWDKDRLRRFIAPVIRSLLAQVEEWQEMGTA